MLNNKNKHCFCPGHWDDIQFAPSQGYVYGCCKATPLQSMEELEERRQKVLGGEKLDCCNYCWQTESAGKESYRDFKLSKWDGTDNVRLLTLTLGNLCNLQCVYCKEKYSSKWQSSLEKFGPIASIPYEPVKIKNEPAQTYIDFFNSNKPSSILKITGGEPFIGTDFYDIMESCDLSYLNEIRVATNLCYKKNNVVNKLLELQDDVKISINPSLDTVNWDIQEQIRYGFDREVFESNLKYLLQKTNVQIQFLSLMTDRSILDVYKTYEYVYNLKRMYPNRIKWFISRCMEPKIHTFSVLTDANRDLAIEQVMWILQELNDADEIRQFEEILVALNNTMYDCHTAAMQSEFYKDFDSRQK